MAEFQKLDVGELDHLKRVGAVAIGDEAGRPVEGDEILGGVRKAQAGRLDGLRAAQRIGLQPDQAGNPVGMCREPVGSGVVHLKDHVFLAQLAQLKSDDSRFDQFNIRVNHAPNGRIQGRGLGQFAGELRELLAGESHRELQGERDRGEIEE